MFFEGGSWPPSHYKYQRAPRCRLYTPLQKNKKIKIFNLYDILQGRPQDLGGGPIIFFFRFGNLHVAKRHAAHGESMRIARGFGGMLPREFFSNRCNLVRFRVYFDQILSLVFVKITMFYIKKNNILDTRLLWGIFYEEIFENMLRLMRFGVCFETKKAIFIKK